MGGRVRRKRQVEQNVWELALARLRSVWDHYDTIAVSFSGGKDSTACLNVALQVARERGTLPLQAIYYDEEAIAPETVEYVQRVQDHPDIELRWMCVPVKYRNACSFSQPWWFPWAPEDEHLWCRELPPRCYVESDLPGFNRPEIAHLNGWSFPPDKWGSVGVVTGIRAAESLQRYRSVAQRVEDNWITHESQRLSDNYLGNCDILRPIYDWADSDVWTGVRELGWDYNRAYDVMHLAGMTTKQQRICQPYGEEPLIGFEVYHKCWPELWERIINRVAGANTAWYYAKTPLYGFKGTARKADDVSWKDHIRALVLRWPEKERRQVAHDIQLLIKRHHAKTRDPIPEEKEHELTGVSWRYLAKLAMRGNFKGRLTGNYGKAA